MSRIDLPLITADTDAGKLQQIQRYLYDLHGQLNYALGQIDQGEQKLEYAISSARKRAEEADVTASPSTFAKMKALIIKSADFVDALYEGFQMNIAEYYLAKSDFGDYLQNTKLTIEGNSVGIVQLYENYQEISGTVNNIYDRAIDTSAYIKTGYLYDNENDQPVYGVEIGQTTLDSESTYSFKASVRVVANRLSFYDANDNEVAYISDKKLYITEADISYLYAGTAYTNTIIMGSGEGTYTIQADGRHLTIS